MSDLLNIGVSGLQAFKRQLDTTSHNIANVNTNGYSRQHVDLSTRPPDYTGFGYVGNGVNISGVRRTVDDFLNNQILTNSTGLSQVDTFHSLVSQVDELLANTDAGLTSSMQGFFNAAQDVANDPSSVPARQVFLSQAESLVDRFQFLDGQLNSLTQQVNSDMTSRVTEVNSIAEAIATLNRSISTSYGNEQNAPNDLLDQRDQLVRDLSQHVDVQVVGQSNGALNVFIGNGQALVIGNESRSLAVSNNAFDPSLKDVSISDGKTQMVITDQLRGGALGGSLNFLDQVLYPAQNELGRIAVGLAGTFNEQHQLGQDLDGNPGGDFFQALNSGSFSPTVLEGNNNSASGFNALSASYTDVSQLTTSNYQVRALGGGQYEVLRLSDNQLTTQTGPSFTIDGMQVDVNSPPSVGDTFLIRPTYQAASRFELAISDPRAVAAGLPVSSTAALGNTGNAVISPGSVTDSGSYVADDYRILLGADAGAAVTGFANGAAATDTEYRLTINGQAIALATQQDDGTGALADLGALANAINADVVSTGVRAHVNAAGTALYLVNDPATSLPISITEELVTTAGTPSDLDSFAGYFGLGTLQGASATTQSTTFAAAADSYVVLDSSGTAVADGAYSSGSVISFNGMEATVSGSAKLGDRFDINRNQGGVGDNRNMIALAALQGRSTLDNGKSSYLDAYGRMVASVGAKTQQAGITRDAQAVLLDQSIAARESVSGVNLDEEAAALIRFQQAYQAAAQVISTANELFQTLINAVGR